MKTPTTTQLTPQQETFAVAFATNGGHATNAAIEAGYSERTARQQGSRLTRLPHVQQRIAQECSLLVATNVPQALAAQRQLLTGARSDMVKHLVAVDMLDRAMGKATTRIEHDIGGELTVRIDLS
jgi:phage terminase small subunit